MAFDQKMLKVTEKSDRSDHFRNFGFHRSKTLSQMSKNVMYVVRRASAPDLKMGFGPLT